MITTRVRGLNGFWQVKALDHLFLAVVHSLPNNERCFDLFSFGQTQESVFEDRNETSTFLSADGIAIEGSLWICGEVNWIEPLRWLELNLKTVIENRKPSFQAPRVTLSPEGDGRLAAIANSKTRPWHALGPLGWTQWLFSPSPVRGRLERKTLVANTADGHVLFFETNDPKWISFRAANGFEPKASAGRGGHVTIVFRRLEGDCRPHDLLERYTGWNAPTPGSLIATDLEGNERDLSAASGIGPVIAQTVVPGPDERPWIFALRERAVGSEVLAFSGDSFRLIGQPLRTGEEVSRLDVIWDDDAWSLLLAHRDGSDWVLHQQRWLP